MAFEDSSFSAESFCGTARLFPLPNLVLFPHVLQPLHVFEPRYRELIEESLAHDNLVAMALLLPGWEPQYEGRPSIHPMACLGQVTSHHRLKDGSYNVLLLGVERVRVLKELAPTKSFREAQVELCPDCYPPEQSALQAPLQKKLRQALVDALPAMPQAREQLDQLLAGDLPLGALADLISYMIGLELPVKIALLEELNVYRRVELLLQHLAGAAPSLNGFPPQFSPN